MSRSGYDDYDGCGDQWAHICWRGAVTQAFRGRRGQEFFKEMLSALDALPEKKLIRNDLEDSGQVCALGAVGKARGVDMSQIDPYDCETVAGTFGVAGALAREVMGTNDEGSYRRETPEERWARMRAWVLKQIKEGFGDPVV